MWAAQHGHTNTANALRALEASNGDSSESCEQPDSLALSDGNPLLLGDDSEPEEPST